MTKHQMVNLRDYLTQWSRQCEALEVHGISPEYNQGRRYGLNIALCALEAIDKGLELAVSPEVVERYGEQYERSRS